MHIGLNCHGNQVLLAFPIFNKVLHLHSLMYQETQVWSHGHLHRSQL